MTRVSLWAAVARDTWQWGGRCGLHLKHHLDHVVLIVTQVDEEVSLRSAAGVTRGKQHLCR